MGTVVSPEGRTPPPDHHPNQEAAMGHAVMTHAPTQATVNYNALPPLAQTAFDQHMETADNAGTNHDYRTAMALAALTAGIPLPADGEIALCACPNCWNCGHIFNANDPDAHPFGQSTGYNLGRIQCPHCTDAHRATDEQ
ncbi:hypothetical protein PV409_36490 [Streptomyces sp. ME02-6979.5a]|uniref:hypothetical protein n=1 Tax=Streptomyces sp. ME02-6979.5a TaxID=462925 RepID=UPI0029BE2029|nr:hypothetical protein [Streptomyces sp. ME02-6979.5a]MDX3343461.1 hypothetical protein [Streptomyces sp. ME02-6979.5a]